MKKKRRNALCADDYLTVAKAFTIWATQKGELSPRPRRKAINDSVITDKALAHWQQEAADAAAEEKRWLAKPRGRRMAIDNSTPFAVTANDRLFNGRYIPWIVVTPPTCPGEDDKEYFRPVG